MTPRIDLAATVAALAGVAAAVALLAGCGSDDASRSELTGIVRQPSPQVDAVALPSLSVPGEEVTFRADDGGIEVVYFGFTSCPDVCPTTLADLTVALRKLEPDAAERVGVVMVTVDPARDLELLDGYITSFVPDGVAAGTADETLLERAAEPFGASWDVRTLADGTIEVDHSPFLYAVDDEGRLVLTWQFGTSSDDLAADLGLLLEDA